MDKVRQYWSSAPKGARILFWIFLGISAALIIGSFFVPPMGKIDPTVLQGVGELQGFAALGVGFECIFAGMNVTLKKGDTHISVSSDKEE